MKKEELNKELKQSIKLIRDSLKMRHNKTWTGFWQAGEALYKIKTDKQYDKRYNFDEFCRHVQIGLPGQPEHRSALASKLITIHDQLVVNTDNKIDGITEKQGLGYTEAYYLSNYLKQKEHSLSAEIKNLVNRKGLNQISQKQFVAGIKTLEHNKGKSATCKHNRPIEAIITITCKTCGGLLHKYEEIYTPGKINS